MSSQDREPHPSEFPIGSPAWEFAMLRLQEARRSSDVNVHIFTDGVEDPQTACKPYGPNDINLNVINIGRASAHPRENGAPDEAAPNENKPEPNTPAAHAAPQESEPEAEPQRVPLIEMKPQCAQDEAAEDEAAREARFADYMASRRRRPLVRKPPYRARR